MDVKRSRKKDTPKQDRVVSEGQVHSVTTINNLPAETLAHLFSYLTHTEKLISRLVCPKWNHQISSYLVIHSYYSLTSKKSLQVVLDTPQDLGMEWTTIKISDHGFVLPSQFKSTITTLDVHLPKFRSRSSQYISVLAEFPSLTTLKVSLDGGGPHDKAKEETDAELLKIGGHIKSIFEKLKILAITFPFNSYSLLSEFLSRIPACCRCCGFNLKLDGFHVSEKKPSSDIEMHGANYYRKHGAVYAKLQNIISHTAPTLKSLTLDFTSKKFQKKLFERIIPNLNTNAKFMKLESVLISRGPSRRYVDADFDTLQEFLKKQTNLKKLKNVILPWCSDASLCQEFVRCLPPDIEFLGNLRDEHITEEFPTALKKLKSVSIERDLHLTGEDFDARNDNIQRLEIDLRKSRRIPVQPLSLYEHINWMWDSLSEIKFIGTGILVFDSDLRAIIHNFSNNNLRVLHLESCRITDFGVLGVRKDDVELRELIKTKRMYYPQAPDEKLLVEVTEPLSNLKKLEKLILVGTNITDVGIILGFKFGLTLKQLILSSKSHKVTDFGLYSLGSNNSGLETFHGSFKRGRISTVGIEKLKAQLPLTESTRKFKVIYKNRHN